MAEGDEKQKSDMRIITVFVLPFIFLIVSIWVIFRPPKLIENMSVDHPKAIIGVPIAYLLSLFLILLLKQQEKKMTLKGFSLAFDGFAGEVILWIVCFIALTWAIYFLW